MSGFITLLPMASLDALSYALIGGIVVLAIAVIALLISRKSHIEADKELLAKAREEAEQLKKKAGQEAETIMKEAKSAPKKSSSGPATNLRKTPLKGARRFRNPKTESLPKRRIWIKSRTSLMPRSPKWTRARRRSKIRLRS